MIDMSFSLNNIDPPWEHDDGKEKDYGALYIRRRDDGKIEITVRTPGAMHESKISIERDMWLKLREID
jgi:hypothetical protein